MGAEFKRSKIVGIGGLFVVVALVLFIALNYGSGANPQGATAAILAIVFIYMAIVLRTQRSDLRRAKAADERAAAQPASQVADPTAMSATDLVAALAVKPVDSEALEGRRAAWAFGERSIGSVGPLIVLIALAVVPWQIWQWKWSLIVVVPIIFIYVIYLCVRLVAGGSGSIDEAYSLAGKMMSPLGLDLVEHPTLKLTPSIVRPSFDHHMSGASVYEGSRHGRGVSVRVEAGADTVTYVQAPVPDFSVAAKGERLTAPDGSPDGVTGVLQTLRPSSHWKGVSVNAGPDGITVIRTKDAGNEWLWDLWLAEALAASAGSRPASSSAPAEGA